MDTAPESNVGNCPVCGNVITSYHFTPGPRYFPDGSKYEFGSVYEFGPCGCRSQTWTVIEGKFVGRSSQNIPPTTIGEHRRENLGKRVHEVWAAWARTQPNPKPEWLVPWDELEERYKEVDRRIGSALWGDFVVEYSEALANAAMKSLQQN